MVRVKYLVAQIDIDQLFFAKFYRKCLNDQATSDDQHRTVEYLLKANQSQY